VSERAGSRTSRLRASSAAECCRCESRAPRAAAQAVLVETDALAMVGYVGERRVRDLFMALYGVERGCD